MFTFYLQLIVCLFSHFQHVLLFFFSIFFLFSHFDLLNEIHRKTMTKKKNKEKNTKSKWAKQIGWILNQISSIDLNLNSPNSRSNVDKNKRKKYLWKKNKTENIFWCANVSPKLWYDSEGKKIRKNYKKFPSDFFFWKSYIFAYLFFILFFLLRTLIELQKKRKEKNIRSGDCATRRHRAMTSKRKQ